MRLPKILLAIVLATFSTSNAFQTLVPSNKEIVYEYKAIIKAGTHSPASYASQFLLRGNLHLQTDGNGTFVKLTDLTYQLYNGILNHQQEHKAQDVLLPKEIEELQEAFAIYHDSDGKVIGISTETNEKQYVRNIKNAIAGILQLDITVMNQNAPYAFTTQEHSIYGYGRVNYNVVPHPDGNIEVHKLHNMIKTTHLYQYHQISKDSLHCDIPYEDPIMHDSQRKYVIASVDGHKIVKYIEAVGAILYNPYEANSDSQYLLANQTIKLIHVVPVKENFQITAPNFENHLTYHMYPSSFSAKTTPKDTIPDITLGRHVIDYQKLVPIVHEILEDMVQYLEEDHIHMKQPDVKRGQSINRIQNILMHFDSLHLEEIHQSLVSKSDIDNPKSTFQVWLHILPIIGTRASGAIIKKLIVKKDVTDEIAVELLRHFPRHILAPTKDLVTEMEWMSNYDGHWDVKKAAILAFGTLVHRAYKYSLQVNQNHKHSFTGYDDYVELHEDDLELKQFYEKYVVEYVEVIKSTSDYKIQMVYMQGLFNMKLESLIGHLHPQFTKGGSRHLRFLTLWALSGVLKKPDQVFNILWPIMANHKEYTELRMAAYTIIMQSKPSASMLHNIYWQMMHESDQEFYHFHYTYVDSMTKTMNPCMQDFKIMLAQIKKYMYPPNHGSSSVHFSDYQDPRYKFSGGSTIFFGNTKDLQIIELGERSELFHRTRQNEVGYIKVYGHKIEVDTTFKFTDLLTTPKNKEWHIEVILTQHLYTYATYYFDHRNSDELLDFFKIFIKNRDQELNHQYLHINYLGNERIAIPTDFGVPALFEFLVPFVHKNNIKVTKEVTDRIVNMHIENKYVEWLHHRQSLSFYNPVVDVWQGISRYNSHDKVLPVRFDVGFNTQEKFLQLSWKRHHDVSEDVVGLRSHVLTKVFVKDDSQKKLLLQSSPHSKEWVIVTNGVKFRNNYTIYRDDNINIGHLWQMAVYDSEHYVSNNSYVRIHNRFTQPFTKSFDSLLAYYWETFRHLSRYLNLMPKTGVHGVMIRGEPSHHHPVSNIDLSIRVNLEPNNETMYNPGGKLITRVTYAIRNGEKKLKTWDLNTILDTNSGHTVNNLKMHLTRTVPGLNDYTICVDGDKKWVNNQVTGNLKVAKTESPDGKCSKNDTIIDVEMIGRKSYEQEHELNVYGDCQYPIPYSVPRYHTLQCSVAHTSLRHYTYNVKTSKVPSEFVKVFWQWWDYLKGHYIWYYSSYAEHHEDVGENNLVLDMVYPMEGKKVDISLTTQEHKYELTELPIHYWQWFGMTPDSTMYSRFFMYWHSFGLFNHCYVRFDNYRVDHHPAVQKSVPNNWTLFVGSDSTPNPLPLHGVYIKQIENKSIGVKVRYHNTTLEFLPQRDGTYSITKDDETSISQDVDYSENWVSYHMLTNEKHHGLLISLPKSGFHLGYDGQHLVVIAPKNTHHLQGQCWNN